MKDENKLNVRMLSDVCMQSRLLKEALESKLPLALEMTPFSELWLEESKPESRNIQMLVIDYSRISDDVLTDYSSFKHISCPDAKEVIINCPQDIEHKLLFKWNNLAGVFYIDDDMDTLIKGMSKILQDEMWLTRKLAQEYILHYRAGNSVVTSQMYAKLTKREQQIIKLLGSGASNIEIADKLFVSENTVKTHLHNVFKKINAKNRLQALIWAKNNIGIEEVNS
ncbi:helix-turn-helix transcriptional regulator [Vibrio tarriae]|uniref:LuxR family transcriptional regulator VpsT n=1 Tax=Vibrio tarriae TaxID=2014742 RepID=UPI000DE43ADA|nr:LuxR family transcriptional regulator VpsT [Vibrio tarriae]QEO47321.1 helix-turn-helix transcriptional regulator [Vibrio cholerae]RBM28988.1 helix-turn-helix transcriptional regulator [Vibrio tarriae]RBM31482.1 helix-turn-helix transcriptional regulator [Vibrio tarriae]RBM35241.1 helix-turn-helix transcriptional regulator [Vibrio tarriae]RBM37892.1 helix-turn-helix transcriptional regulator [Vibrio tarriae]